MPSFRYRYRFMGKSLHTWKQICTLRNCISKRVRSGLTGRVTGNSNPYLNPNPNPILSFSWVDNIHLLNVVYSLNYKFTVFFNIRWMNKAVIIIQPQFVNWCYSSVRSETTQNSLCKPSAMELPFGIIKLIQNRAVILN